MSAIHIRRKIDSEILSLPELQQFIGRAVDIVIEETSTAQPSSDSISDEFWNTASKVPGTEEEFAAPKAPFRLWRPAPRFEAHWPMIDRLLARNFEATKKWAIALKGALELADYDYEAVPEQDAYEISNAKERLK